MKTSSSECSFVGIGVNHVHKRDAKDLMEAFKVQYPGGPFVHDASKFLDGELTDVGANYAKHFDICRMAKDGRMIVYVQRTASNYQHVACIAARISGRLQSPQYKDRVFMIPAHIAWNQDNYIMGFCQEPIEVTLRKLKGICEIDAARPACSICLESSVARNPNIPCGHVFHEKCLADWFVKSNSRQCPVCKQEWRSAIPVNGRICEELDFSGFVDDDLFVYPLKSS